jgi:MFS family permease
MNEANPTSPALASKVTVFASIALTMIGVYYVYDSIGPVAELLVRQLGFTDVQLGLLNAVYSLPNIVLVLVGGILVDRFTARRAAVFTASLCFLGALLTAFGSWYPTMVAGRLLFGIGAETLYVAVFVALAQWFEGRYFALLFASAMSFVSVGSYLVMYSPTFADSLYAQGWQPPLFLAAGFAGLALLAMITYFFCDRREAQRGTLTRAAPSDRFDWGSLLRFPKEYWYLVGMCVAVSACVAPFRSTFGVKYLQHAHHLSLSEASALNSYISLAAIFASSAFGFIADRTRHYLWLLAVGALVLPLSMLLFGTGSAGLWIPTALLGVSFSLLPILWPAVSRTVRPDQAGTAFGLMSVLQNVGLAGANLYAGYLNDHNGAGATHPEGYDAMLWFFGALSVAGCVFAVLLITRKRSSIDSPKVLDVDAVPERSTASN